MIPHNRLLFIAIIFLLCPDKEMACAHAPEQAIAMTVLYRPQSKIYTVSSIDFTRIKKAITAPIARNAKEVYEMCIACFDNGDTIICWYPGRKQPQEVEAVKVCRDSIQEQEMYASKDDFERLKELAKKLQ